jgi:CHAT domain-containing protein
LSHEQFRTLLQADVASKRPANIAALGAGLAQHALPAVVREALAHVAGPIVFVLDREASTLPWETLRCEALLCQTGTQALSLTRVMTRVLECASLEDEQARSAVTRQAGEALVIANPTGDLPKACDEGALVRDLLVARGVQTTLLLEAQATHARVQAALAKGPAIVHYAGHAHFDSASPQRSGLQLADGVLLSQHLRQSSQRPRLVILNACESARTRKQTDEKAAALTTRSVGVSLAEAIIRSGVTSVVGTWWPVLDASALLFSEALYNTLFTEGVGLSVLHARQKLASNRQASIAADSVNYVLYGETA